MGRRPGPAEPALIASATSQLGPHESTSFLKASRPQLSGAEPLNSCGGPVLVALTLGTSVDGSPRRNTAQAHTKAAGAVVGQMKVGQPSPVTVSVTVGAETDRCRDAHSRRRENRGYHPYSEE